MPNALSGRIVKFLGYGRGSGISDLRGFSPRDWTRALPWLDASGLALYFLNRVELSDGSSVVPPSILSRLRQNREDNRERNRAFTEEMRSINQSFHARGIEFAVLKGSSLVPEYCLAFELRQQCDLDYLVPENDIYRASNILRRMEYSRVQGAPGSYTFARSPGRLPSRHSMYKAGLNYSVELHTALWDNSSVATLEDLPHALDRRRLHQAPELVFPALSREDQFIYQCMHVLSHILQFWIRLAWLYEIATFVEGTRTDATFWQAVQTRIDGRIYQSKAIQLVLLLAAALFDAQVPELRTGEARAIPLWVSEYGREWARRDLPGSKLSLFLFPEFVEESRRRRLLRQRLLPLHWPHSAAQVSAARPRRDLRIRLTEYRYAGQRFAFHLREGWRYLAEKGKWRRCVRESGEGARSPLKTVTR